MATSLEEIRATYNRINKEDKSTRKATSRQRKELDEAALEVIPYLEAEKAYNEWAEDFHRKTANMSEKEVINYVNRQKNDERIAKANHWEGVMNLMSPGQYYRAIIDDKPFDESLWYGNSGWVDEDFARRNPRLSLAINTGIDGTIGALGYKGYKGGQRIYSESVRPSLTKAQLAREFNKAIKETNIDNPKYKYNHYNLGDLDFKLNEFNSRYRAGDIELDDPNLFYHIDGGDGVGYNSNKVKGAYVKDGKIYPGEQSRIDEPAYSWWNKGEPYTFMDKFNRLIVTKDNPNLLHVRSQPYRIGQWTGNPKYKTVVTNKEYVSSEPIEIKDRNIFYYDKNNRTWNRKNNNKSRLLFYERPSKLTEAEKAGIPKGERNAVKNPSLKDFGELEFKNGLFNNEELGEYFDNGAESWTFKKDGKVNKVMRSPYIGLKGYNNFNSIPFNKSRIGDFVKQYLNPRNKHDIFERLNLEGIIKYNGEEYPVVSQRKLNNIPHAISGEQVAEIKSQLNKLLEENGYEYVEDTGNGYPGYRNEKGTISDVDFRNMGYTPEGVLKLFDIMSSYKYGGRISLAD